MEGNFGRDTYRSGYAAAPLISSTPVSHNHPLYRPCRIRQDDFCSSTKIAARYIMEVRVVCILYKFSDDGAGTGVHISRELINDLRSDVLERECNGSLRKCHV